MITVGGVKHLGDWNFFKAATTAEHDGASGPHGLPAAGAMMLDGKLPAGSEICIGGKMGAAIGQGHITLAFHQAGHGIAIAHGLIGAKPAGLGKIALAEIAGGREHRAGAA